MISGVDASVIAHRLMGDWQPTADSVRQFLAMDTADADISRPYPFCLAYPLEGPVEDLGSIAEWQVEWKWDGIRSQLIRRRWRTFLWSRGEELITDCFPEIQAAGAALGEGTALDGEVLPWKNGGPLPFAMLQRRIGRKVLDGKILANVPAALVAYDLLEFEGEDVRERPLEWRRERLAHIVERLATPAVILSPRLGADSWEQLASIREEARSRGVEGFMLKRHGSQYGVGRKRGDWWKWKIAPHSVDAVLIHGLATAH